MAINYSVVKHAVAYPTKMLAKYGGKHVYNIKLSTACDNGNLIAKGDIVELDLYEEATATTFEGKIVLAAPNGNWYVEVTDPGDALFVYNEPINSEEWTREFSDESSFYNGQDDTVRGYEPAVGDVVEVSGLGFVGTPAVDATITGISSKKMQIGA